MAFCGQCGATLVEGFKFCSSCGASSAPGDAPSAGAGPAPGAPASAGAAAGGLTPNLAALLAYIAGFITGIIFLVIEPYNRDRFVRFHAFQSIFFNVAIIVFWIVFSLVTGMLSYVTAGIAGLILLPLSLLLGLAFLAIWVFLMIKAYNNEQFMLPIIGALAAKQAG